MLQWNQKKGNLTTRRALRSTRRMTSPPVDFDIIEIEPTRPLLDNVPSNANFKLARGHGQRIVAG
jgi:hypothetical protein